jgi:hypothetical protein
MENETDFNSVPAALRHFIKRDELTVKQLHLWAGGDDSCDERTIYNKVSGVSPVALPMLVAWLSRMQGDIRLRVAQAALSGSGLTVSLIEAERQPDLMAAAIKADDLLNDLMGKIHNALVDRHICGQDSAIIEIAANLLIKTIDEIKATLPRPTPLRLVVA